MMQTDKTELIKFINTNAGMLLQAGLKFETPEQEAAFWKGEVYKYMLMTCAALKDG